MTKDEMFIRLDMGIRYLACWAWEHYKDYDKKEKGVQYVLEVCGQDKNTIHTLLSEFILDDNDWTKKFFYVMCTAEALNRLERK
jgi:hypothetical protein